MASYDKAVWDKHRENAYWAVAAMLSQYGSLDWAEVDTTAAALSASPARFKALMAAEAAIGRLSSATPGPKGEWFQVMYALAKLADKYLKPWGLPEVELPLWHDFMSAGEAAFGELERFGFVTAEHGGGR